MQNSSEAPIVFPLDPQQQVAYQNVATYDAAGQPAPVQPVSYLEHIQPQVVADPATVSYPN